MENQRWTSAPPLLDPKPSRLKVHSLELLGWLQDNLDYASCLSFFIPQPPTFSFTMSTPYNIPSITHRET